MYTNVLVEYCAYAACLMLVDSGVNVANGFSALMVCVCVCVYMSVCNTYKHVFMHFNWITNVWQDAVWQMALE